MLKQFICDKVTLTTSTLSRIRYNYCYIACKEISETLQGQQTENCSTIFRVFYFYDIIELFL